MGIAPSWCLTLNNVDEMLVNNLSWLQILLFNYSIIYLIHLFLLTYSSSMFLVIWMMTTEWAICCVLFLRWREFSLSVGGEPITVANSSPEISHAASSYHGLIEWWLHRVLEGFPTGVTWVSKLTIVRLEFHVLWFSFHTYWFSWLRFVLWRPLDIVDVFLFTLL